MGGGGRSFGTPFAGGRGGHPAHAPLAPGLADGLRVRAAGLVAGQTGETVDGSTLSAPSTLQRGSAPGSRRSDGARAGIRSSAGTSSGRPLIGPPSAGPSVQNPRPAADLRVLGAATMPPGSVPDPRGAVTVGPAGPGFPGRAEPGRPATPRERWEASVAAAPLEAPRPLPTAFHAMATAITGRARPPLFTTGPATRRALAAAGALGATTGTTVHLPATPTQVSAVLAHELTHTRSPVRRPRFFLGGASSLLDDDERSALSAGKQAVQTGAGIVDSLPVGGGIGAVSDVAQRAAKAAVLDAVSGPMGSMLSQAQSFAGNTMGDAMGAATEAVGGAAGDAMNAATGAVDAVGGAVKGAAGAVKDAAGAAKAALDPDQVVEIVERRLLREIERRGGRWAGMF